jgi:hypothetical protein
MARINSNEKWVKIFNLLTKMSSPEPILFTLLTPWHRGFLSKADTCSYGQEIHHVKLMDLYCVQRSPPFSHILNHFTEFLVRFILTVSFHLHISGFFPRVFSIQFLYAFFMITHSIYPAHLIFVDLFTMIGGIKIMKLLMLFTAPCFFLFLISKHSHQ